MNKIDDVKERIIDGVIGLIEDSHGTVAEINMRAIAEKAGVGVGLINYHFQTKENLLDIAVERIIGAVISSFRPPVSDRPQHPVERLKQTAKLVADFLIENPAVARISILSDDKNPRQGDNTMRSAMGFANGLGGLALSQEERLLMAFALTSVLQALFLRRDLSSALFGFDMTKKEERDVALDFLIEKLFGGVRYE